MKIKVLGTRGEIPLRSKRHNLYSGILIDDVLLFDLGEKRYLDYHPQGVFITHLHPDHAFFIKQRKSFLINVPVYLPEKCDKLYGNVRLLTAVEMRIGDYTIVPVPVVHSVHVKSCAFLIASRGKSVFYTGDLAAIKPATLKALPPVDLVIAEASFIRRGGLTRKNKKGKVFGHAGVPDIIEMFRKKTSRLLFTHYGSWFLRDVNAGNKKLRSLSMPGLSIEVAYDGAEFRI